MKNLKYTSIKALATHFNLDAKTAKTFLQGLRFFEQSAGMNVDGLLDYCNDFLEGYGVVSIRGHEWRDRYFGDSLALYVNTGDTYNPTILYDVRRKTFYLTDMGSWAEKHGDEII